MVCSPIQSKKQANKKIRGEGLVCVCVCVCVCVGGGVYLAVPSSPPSQRFRLDPKGFKIGPGRQQREDLPKLRSFSQQ